MKVLKGKIILLLLHILLAFLTAEKTFSLTFRQCDLYNSTNLSLEELGTTAGCSVLFSLPKINTSIKLNGSVTVNKTEYASWEDLFLLPISFLKENSTLRYGNKIDFSFSKLPFQTEILLGTLSFSKAYSRLKSPELSLKGSLHSPSQIALGFAPRLPSYTSKENPFSIALELTPKEKLKKVPALQASYNNDCTLFSLYKILPLTLQSTPLDLSYSVTGAYFYLSKNIPSTWYLKQPYFLSGSYTALEAETSISTPHARLSFALGMHESPFSLPKIWFRSEDSLLIENFTLNTSFFYADKGIITLDGSYMHTLMQAQINPQVKFSINKKSIHTGIIFAADFLETSARIPENYKKYSCSSKILIQEKKLSKSLEGTVKYSTQTDEVSYAINAEYNKKLGKFKSKSKAYLYKTSEKEKLTLTQEITPHKGFISGAQVSLVSQREQESNEWQCQKLTASGSLRISSGKAKITGKLTFLVTF